MTSPKFDIGDTVRDTVDGVRYRVSSIQKKSDGSYQYICGSATGDGDLLNEDSLVKVVEEKIEKKVEPMKNDNSSNGSEPVHEKEAEKGSVMPTATLPLEIYEAIRAVIPDQFGRLRPYMSLSSEVMEKVWNAITDVLNKEPESVVIKKEPEQGQEHVAGNHPINNWNPQGNMSNLAHLSLKQKLMLYERTEEIYNGALRRISDHNKEFDRLDIGAQLIWAEEIGDLIHGYSEEIREKRSRHREAIEQRMQLSKKVVSQEKDLRRYVRVCAGQKAEIELLDEWLNCKDLAIEPPD